MAPLSPKEVFVSLNFWHEPGFILEAEKPQEIVSGLRNEWVKLRVALEKYKTHQTDGMAIGYFTYEGDFWFGFFSEVRSIPSLSSDTQQQLVPQLQEKQSEKKNLANWTSNFTRTQFEKGVEKIQDYIRAGDIYQVNLAQRFQMQFEGDSYALFKKLSQISPAAGAAYIQTGEQEILSSSPELFLKITGRHIVTKPIKGTRPRGHDEMSDRKLAEELQSDPKERAELVMITDLERNDLGQVCDYGSVQVTKLAEKEAHAQVFHLVSTVEGTLRQDVDALTALEACFPGGSITGAPKKRAREIIAELESSRRGIYTGAIGYFRFNGDAAFNIAIRTLVREVNELSFYVGSGITAGSIPSREYEETLHKALGMKLAVENYLHSENKTAEKVTT